jgi:hypothetical protein
VTKSKPLAVSYERCHELLEICEPSDFEKESGLKWRERRGGRANAGSWAGCVKEEGVCGKLKRYWLVSIDSKKYRVSRIIYFMSYGIDPYPMEVDHINRNSLDNTINNLRIGDNALQGQNQGIRSDNKSGVKGVSWHKQTSKWRAYIKVDDKQKYLGLYTTLKEAAEARNAAVREYWREEVWEANLVDIEAL